MRRTLRTAHTLAVVLGCALPLAACGGSDEVAGPPTPTAPTSVSVSPTPSAPEREKPEDFIRRWFAAAHEMATTGQTGEFEKMIDPGCKSCSEFLTTTRRIYASGGHVEESPTTIHWIHSSKLRMHGADATYFIRESTRPSRYREKPGAPWKHLTGGTDTQIFYLKRTEFGWLMLENAQLAGSYKPAPDA